MSYLLTRLIALLTFRKGLLDLRRGIQVAE